MIKPYSESCDQNREVILSIISPLLSGQTALLEIGSGTGQHAVFFAEKMPHVNWHTSDCSPYLDGINMWLDEAGLVNVERPFELDVSTSRWPVMDVDAVFTANSIHIMSEQDAVNFVDGVGRLLNKNGDLIIYGPFNYEGKYTSASNERFDQWLKDRDVESGIKNFEDIVKRAELNGMSLKRDYEMPANNRILHFVKG